MQFLKANTQVKVVIGPFVDVTDAFTPETGITLGAADEAELIKHDASAVTDISAATWAAITGCDGYYNLTLTTSHTDTEGMLTVVIQDDSVCLPVRHEFMVMAEAAYDSMYAAKDTGYMDVNVKAISEDTTAADNCEAAFDTTGFGFTNCTMPTTTTVTNQVTADVTAISGDTTAANNAESAFDGTGYGFTGCTMPTVTTLTGHTAQTGDSYARLGAPAGASIAADIADVPTVSEFNARTLAAASYFDPTADTVANVTTVATVTNDVGVNEWNGVALSTTNPLPNAAAGAAGGLPTDSTGKTSFNDITTANVNTEVVDVLKTDTISDLSQGAPPATPTFEEAVMYLYSALRNKIDVDSSNKEFHNDAGTVIWKKGLSDNGTTYTEAEGVTGP